jgi:hypothetical protein
VVNNSKSIVLLLLSEHLPDGNHSHQPAYVTTAPNQYFATAEDKPVSIKVVCDALPDCPC